MKKKGSLVSCLLLLASLIPLVAAAQGGGIVDPYEMGDDFDRAYGPLQLGPQYAAYFASPYDKDFYYFDANQVGTIEIDLGNVPQGYTYGLILYDKNREIASLDVQGQGDKRLSFQMSFKGRYYLMVDVRAGNYDANRPYLLRVLVAQGGGEQRQGSDSYEDNNTYRTAYGPLESGKTYEAYCWDEYDADYYYISLNANSTVKAELKNICADCDYDLFLLDSNLNSLASSGQARGQDESLAVSNVPPGTYYLLIVPYSFSRQSPYRLTVTYNQAAGGGQQGPQPGNEAAWARTQIEAMGYTILYDPGVMDFEDGSQAAVAIEDPRSFDLRLSNETSRRQAVDTWGVLLTAFDVDALWIGLTYQSRYVIYYVVGSDNFHQFVRGSLSWDNLPINYGVWEQGYGWVSDAKDFMDKNF